MTEQRANTMSTLPRPALAGIMVLCLVGVVLVQGYLNEQRGRMNPTYVEPLSDAPPMLALTTEALGGFRGIISTYLWLRSNEMQLKKNYPEQMQLGEWITQLQPDVPQAWANRSWNLAYNISREYPEPEMRWKYIQSAIRILRDEGIRYNPDEPLIYHQIAYTFQHKIGHNLDDHHRYYKHRWMGEMIKALWSDPVASNQSQGVPDFDALISPQTEEEKARAEIVREVYGLDPREMRAVHQRYGWALDHEGKIIRDEEGKPINCLDWRMAETHALYWSYLGLKRCSHTPGREKELHKLEKTIYVSMMYNFQRGKLSPYAGVMIDPAAFFSGRFMSVPNLESAGAVHQTYLEIINLAKDSRELHYTEGTSEIGHIHFLRRVIQWLYFYNREEEARNWLKTAVKLYPKKMSWFPGYDKETDTYRLDDIVMSNLKDDMERGGDTKTQALLSGVLTKHLFYRADGEEEQADQYLSMAIQVYDHYADKFKKAGDRMSMGTFEEVMYFNTHRFLTLEPPAVTSALRRELGLGPDEFPKRPGVPEGPQLPPEGQ